MSKNVCAHCNCGRYMNGVEWPHSTLADCITALRTVVKHAQDERDMSDELCEEYSARIERLRAELFENLEQLGKCRELLRRGVELAGRATAYADVREWLEAARAAGGDDETQG